VVGYSGAADDGIIRALACKDLTAAKTIYWCVTGQRPYGPYIRAVEEVADVKFVRITDSDELFLRLWCLIMTLRFSGEDHPNPPLSSLDLFTFLTEFRRWAPTGQISSSSWWYPPAEWPHKKLDLLRRRLLPELLKADRDDESRIMHECLPDSMEHGFGIYAGAQLPYSEWKRLYDLMPIEIPWTRRNRKLVIRALSTDCDEQVRFEILAGLSEWGYNPIR
jgi:hypothetical protein